MSTVEYVIVLMVIALLGIAAWRGFGAGTSSRAADAQHEVGTLGDSVDGRRGGAATGAASTAHMRVEDATMEQAPPQDDGLFGPVALVGAAALLVLAMLARRMLRKDGGEGGAGGASAS